MAVSHQGGILGPCVQVMVMVPRWLEIRPTQLAHLIGELGHGGRAHIAGGMACGDGLHLTCGPMLAVASLFASTRETGNMIAWIS